MRLSGFRVGPLLFTTGRKKGEEGCLLTLGKMILLPFTLALLAASWPMLACRAAGRWSWHPNAASQWAVAGVVCTGVWIAAVVVVAVAVA